MKIDARKYTAIISAGVIITLVWVASYSAIFQSLDNAGYDFLIQTPLRKSVSEQVFVVEADGHYAHQGDEVWLRALQNLLKLNARQVVFGFLPASVSEEFYQLAADSGKAVFGRALQRPVTEQANSGIDGQPGKQGYPLQALPAAATGKDIAWGIAAMPESQYGVFRSQPVMLELDGETLPGFDYLAAQQRSTSPPQLPETAFRVNFSGGIERLPRLSIERILSGNIVSEMIAGRTILLGVADSSNAAGFYTPISSRDGPISRLMFQGFALDTLLSGRAISSLPVWGIWSLIIVTAVASLFLFQWLSFQNAIRSVLALSALYLLSCWLLLHSLFVWLPFSEFFLALWLSFAVAWRYRLTQEKRIVDQVLKDLSFRLHNKTFPVSVYATEDPWSQLITMIHQTLQLNRVIFLDRVRDDHRLIEIKALHCSIADILEKRRDYHRYPYALAISENRPVLLDRPYLRAIDRHERQYLAPLAFAGEVLGFWAFTIDPDLVVENAHFKTLIHNYMEQISEILYYRKEWQKRKANESNRLLRYLRFEGGAGAVVQHLQGTVGLLEKRISDLLGVFNNLHTCCILYDLFGRVLLVNKGMEELNQAQGIKPYQMTLLDFIAHVTQYDIAKVQELLQQTITQLQSQSLTFSAFGGHDNYMLCLHPLQVEEDGDAGTIADEAHVFEIRGVLLELVDLTDLKIRYSLKETVFEQFGGQLRETLGKLLTDLPHLSSEALSAEKQQLAGEMQNKLIYLLAKLNNIGAYAKLIADRSVDYYPQDANAALKNLNTRWQDTASEKKIQIHFASPEAGALVLASAGGLDEMLNTIMQVMIEDTYQGGEIQLSMAANGAEAVFGFHNQGIGLLQDNLQQYLDHDTFASDNMARLAQAMKTVRQWQGKLTLSSTTGKGTSVELSLKQLI